VKYWAFLSYSHRDAKWGDWLHKELETYRVPRRLAGKQSRDGAVPERVFPIFRDREELPVSADLGANINEALEQSRYLIVICSPHSAQSRWVNEEIRAFRKLGRQDRILTLIVGGEPNASDGKQGFSATDECFAEALRFRALPKSDLNGDRTEPIAADARDGKDGKTNAKLKLLAGLLGVNYDDLRQREHERRLRQTRRMVVAAAVLISAFAALSVRLFFKQREARALQVEAERARDDASAERVAAETARDQARTRLSDNYFERGLSLLDSGDRRQGAANLIAALRADPNNTYAADRLLFELNYDDWLMASAYVPLPPEVCNFSTAFQETPVLDARLLENGRGLEATTLDFTGRPARVFQTALTTPAWKVVSDNRIRLTPDSRGEDVSINDISEHLDITSAEADTLLGNLRALTPDADRNTTYFSPDKKWAAVITLEERALAECPVSLFDCWQNRRIVLRDYQGKESALTGLPAFDVTHGLVWLFRSNSAEAAAQQLDGGSRPVLEAIDLIQGKPICDAWFVPVRNIEALRPRVSRNGRWVAARYAVNNRRGEVLNVFELNPTESSPLRLTARELVLPGHLREVTEDGGSFVAVLPTAVGLFHLLRHEKPAGLPQNQPEQFNPPPDVSPIEAVSKDGKLKVAGNAKGHFTVFDQPSGIILCAFESRYVAGEGGRSIIRTEFSADSRFLLVWGYSTGGGIVDTEIYDPLRGRLLFPRFSGVLLGHNDRGLPGIRRMTGDNREVEMMNRQVVTLRFTTTPMPTGFADLAEAWIGARIDSNNVYQICGEPGAPPCMIDIELKKLAAQLEPDSDWTKFANRRLSSLH
jgi:hypothetical protein